MRRSTSSVAVDTAVIVAGRPSAGTDGQNDRFLVRKGEWPRDGARLVFAAVPCPDVDLAFAAPSDFTQRGRAIVTFEPSLFDSGEHLEPARFLWVLDVGRCRARRLWRRERNIDASGILPGPGGARASARIRGRRGRIA